jgi:DNA-binding XRE family transcriptional regulator
MVTTPPSLNPRSIRQSLGISRDRMGRLLEVTSKTVARLEDQDRLPAQSAAATRLAKLKELADLGLLVYTPEGFVQFMATPLPAFGGLNALQMIERGDIDRVFAELASTYEGVPS